MGRHEKRVSDRELVRMNKYLLLDGVPLRGRLGKINALFDVDPEEWEYYYDMATREHVLKYG